MENEIVMGENPIVDHVIEDPTLAPTDEVIPVPDSEVSVDPDCLGCGELTPECPVCNGEATVTLGGFFGTIQECVTITWRFHLKTKKHHIHVALHDFYDDALKVVDDIIEQYQGINGVVDEPFINCVTGDGKTEVQYLQELKSFIEEHKCILGNHSEINSTIDNYLGLIDSTIYLIVSFNESKIKSFDEFCYEDYCNESCRIDSFGNAACDNPDDPDFDPENECEAEEE